MKSWKIIILSIATPVLLVTGYFLFKKHTNDNFTPYTIQKPRKQEIKQYINASGRLQAKKQITVGSLVAGRIIKLNVDNNDFVKKDQILVELDDGIGDSAIKKLKAALQEAQANLDYISGVYKRQKALYKSGQISQEAFDEQEKNYKTSTAKVEQTKADLEIRQKEYNNLFIKALGSGVIISKKVDLGQMVTARLQATELFTIAKDLKKMEAEIDIDESDIGLVKIGQEAMFTVDAFPKKPFTAKVKAIHYQYKIVDNVITYAIILDVQNPKLKLRPGMTTNVDIKVADAHNAICVPNKSLRVNKSILETIAKAKGFSCTSIPSSGITEKHKDTLWIMPDDHTFKQIEVKLGASDGKYTQVKKGLSESNNVIIEAFDINRKNPIKMMGKMKV